MPARIPRPHYAAMFGPTTGDRVRLGEVIDFLDVYISTYHWPAFNVADSAVSIGAVILFYKLIRGQV